MRGPHLTFGPYAFDPGSRVLRRSGEELPLPPRVLGVLEVLLRRAGDVVPRQELIESVWKDAFVTDTSLAEAVSALRQALGDDPQTPTYVQTLHRRGYRFVAPVTEADLDGQARTSTPGSVATDEVVRPSIGGALVPWSVATICAVLAIVAVWHSVSGRRAGDSRVARFVVSLPPDTRLDARGPAIALSADGALAVWAGCDPGGCRLYSRSFDRLEPSVVQGTEGAACPFVSPDARWIGFFADGKLKKVPVNGGVPVTLADAPDIRGAVWTPQREIIFAGSTMGGLWRVADRGGEPAKLTSPSAADGEVGHAWPSLTPSGDVLLFTITLAPAATSGRLAAIAADAFNGNAAWRSLAAAGERPIAATHDTVVFAHSSELQSTWFDRQRLSLAGGTPTVISPVGSSRSGSHFAISRSGTLAMAPATADTPPLSWLDGHKDLPAARFDRQLDSLVLSHDGSRLAGIEGTDAGRADIWVADVLRGTTTRITHSGRAATPMWHGSTLFYASRHESVYEVWSRDVDSPSGAPRRIYTAATHSFPIAMRPDGSALVVLQQHESSGSDLWLLTLASGQLHPLVQTPFEDIAASFSPDGSLLAYQSNESGRWEVYVQQLSDGKRTVVSRSGGIRPIWTTDASRLCFQDDGEVACAAVERGAQASVGTPRRIAAIGDGELIGFDRGGRILVRRLPAQPASLLFALNWTRELRQLLGPQPAAVPR